MCRAARQRNCTSWGDYERRPLGYAIRVGFVRRIGPPGHEGEKSCVAKGMGVVLGEVMGTLLGQWVSVCPENDPGCWLQMGFKGFVGLF